MKTINSIIGLLAKLFLGLLRRLIQTFAPAVEEDHLDSMTITISTR